MAEELEDLFLFGSQAILTVTLGISGYHMMKSFFSHRRNFISNSEYAEKVRNGKSIKVDDAIKKADKTKKSVLIINGWCDSTATTESKEIFSINNLSRDGILFKERVFDQNI